MAKLHYLVEPHGNTLATRIVSEILSDVTDRRGRRQPWDTFDDEAKERIVRHWIRLVNGLLKESA